MKSEDFDKIVEKRISSVRRTLLTKAEEYASNEERFANFKAAATMNEQTTEKALWGMLSKHVISVRDMCKGGEITPRLIDEKVGDWIVYGFLLEGVLWEKFGDVLSKEDIETFYPED